MSSGLIDITGYSTSNKCIKTYLSFYILISCQCSLILLYFYVQIHTKYINLTSHKKASTIFFGFRIALYLTLVQQTEYLFGLAKNQVEMKEFKP